MNIKMNRLFTGTILARGRKYQASGAVLGIRLYLPHSGKDEDIAFSSVVYGTTRYDVEGVIDPEGNVVEIRCDCPYADTSYCKHMAATLLEMEYIETDAASLKKRAAYSLDTAVHFTKAEREIVKVRKYTEHLEDLRLQRLEKLKQEEQERERIRLEKQRARLLYVQNRKEIRPFDNDGDSTEYKYFDFSKIMSPYTVYDIDYEEAKKAALENKDKFRIELGYTSDVYSETVLVSQARFGFDTSAVIGPDRLLSSNCNNSLRDNGIYQDPDSNKTCLKRELLALLITMRDYLEKTKSSHLADYTSPNGTDFINDFKASELPGHVGTEQIGLTDNTVFLYPVLEKQGSDISPDYKLRLKIGTNKLYFVKQISDLVDSVVNRGKSQIGKYEEIDFALQAFDPQGQKLFQTVFQCVKENRELIEEYYRVNYGPSRYYYTRDRDEPKQIRSQIDMTPDLWDAMYDYAAEGKLIYLGFTVETAEGSPDLRLTLRQVKDDTGHLKYIVLDGTVPNVINGVYGNYCLVWRKNECVYRFYRISSEVYRKIRPLESYQKNGVFNVRIGVNHLSEFFFNVLPELRKLVAIDEKELDDIEAYLPPMPSFSAYLDAENRVPVCRLEAVYGEDSYSVFDWDTKDPDRTQRSEPAEMKARELVRRYFPFAEPEKDRYTCGPDEGFLFMLLDEGVSVMSEQFEINVTKEFEALRIRRPPPVHVGVSISGDLLAIDVESDEISRQELLELLQSYKLKRKYHRLRDGGFVRINEEIADLNALFEALHVTPKEFVAGKMNIPAYRALYLDKMLEDCDSLYATRDQRFRSLVKDFKTVSDSDYEVPVSLSNVMRGYQSHGFKWLSTLRDYGFGGILADDMGLGKTLQMISVLLASHESGDTGPSLVVCPASLVYNWQEEFTRFAPQLRVGAIAGKKSDREEMINDSASYDVLITSYGLLKRDIELYEDIRFRFEVLDEAQFIKTQTTGSAKSVKLIKAAHRFALTGTPIENRLSELWSIFDFLMPGYLYGYDTFRREFETPIVRQNDEDIGNRLRRMVAPFILRRLKSDVLKDLPDKIEEVRYVRFEGEQKKLYDAQALRLKNLIDSQTEDETKHSKILILAELMRIRQICCDPGLLFESFNDGSAKRLACLELIQSAIAGEHRVLLFSQFTSMLELLKKDLTEAGIEWYTITGATPKKERVDLVRKFNEGNTPVFLISLKAGGTGLNLTGADVVIHYDPWWNIAAQNQATDRAHRIGQTKNVCVYKLIAKNTIEENILKLQESKKELAENILSGELGGIAGMSREELLSLIG